MAKKKTAEKKYSPKKKTETVASKKKAVKKAVASKLTAKKPTIELPPVSVEPIDDLLQLIDEPRTPPASPKPHDVRLLTPATERLIQSLEESIHANRDLKVMARPRPGETVSETYSKLGNVLLSITDTYRPAQKLFDEWEQSRPDELRDPDGLEFYRAYLLFSLPLANWDEYLNAEADRVEVGKLIPQFKYQYFLRHIIQWYLPASKQEAALEFYFDVRETFFACTPQRDLKQSFGELRGLWWDRQRDLTAFVRDQHFNATADIQRKLFPRLWEFLRWFDCPVQCGRREGIFPEAIICAYLSGLASKEDFVRWLFEHDGHRQKFGNLKDFLRVARKSDDYEVFYERGSWKIPPASDLTEIVDRITSHAIQQQLNRTSDEPNEWTEVAKLSSVPAGLDTFVDLLRRRASLPAKSDRAAVLTELLSKSKPLSTDAQDQFAEAMQQLVTQKVIKAKEIQEFTFLFPAWIQYVAAMQTEPQAWIEAVIWIVCHNDSMGDERLANALGFFKDVDVTGWRRLLAERTTVRDLDGPVPEDQPVIPVLTFIDIEWFHCVYAPIADDWDQLMTLAKVEYKGASYQQSVRLSNALRGNLDREQLIDDIRNKHRQESLKLLGVLAFGENAAADLARRQEVIAEYGAFADGRRFYEGGEYEAYLLAARQLEETAAYFGINV